MFRYVSKTEFVTLVSSKVPSGTQAATQLPNRTIVVARGLPFDLPRPDLRGVLLQDDLPEPPEPLDVLLAHRIVVSIPPVSARGVFHRARVEPVGGEQEEEGDGGGPDQEQSLQAADFCHEVQWKWSYFANVVLSHMGCCNPHKCFHLRRGQRTTHAYIGC